MPVISGIAGKIFGLAVLLLAMTICLVFVLFWQVKTINHEFQFVAHHDIPLGEAFSDLNEYGLRRRLAFERQIGALTNPHPDQAILEDSKKNYSLFSEKLTSEFIKIKTLLSEADEQNDEGYGEVRAIFNDIERTYPTVTARQQEVISLLEKGDLNKAGDLLSILNDFQSELQRNRADLQNKSLARIYTLVSKTDREQQRVVWLALALTTCAVLLGLFVAAMISRKLVTPIWSLIAGMKSVKSGNFDVEVPVASKDEIGTLTDTFNFFVKELSSKEQIKKTFGKYIDPRVLEKVILPSGIQSVPSQQRQMTIVFSDLVGFTGLSEQLTPTAIVEILNRFFTLQADAIQKYEGIIDKFIGDSVMAFWGPPFTGTSDHATLACLSAQAQMKALEQFRNELPELTGLKKNTPKIDLRIGIGTGDVVIGNIGSENSKGFTVIGDAVNIASRLEGANKLYGSTILLSEATFQLATDSIIAREIDCVIVKGKSDSVIIYELLGMKEEVTPLLLKIRDTFQKGLLSYRQQNWNSAKEHFNECLELNPSDTPAKTYLSRIHSLENSKLTEDWNGTTVFSIK